MNQNKEEHEFAYESPRIFTRTFIPSQFIKNKEKEVFIIHHEGIVLEVIRTFNEDEPIQVFVNGEPFETVDKNEKKEFPVKSDIKEHTVSIWNARTKGFFFTNLIRREGVAITINDVPVQNTLADPFLNLKEGKFGIYIFLVIMILKLILGYILSETPAEGFANVYIYAILGAGLIFALFLYDKKPQYALWQAILIALVETIEFVLSSVLYNPLNTTNLLFWGALRTGAIFAMARSMNAIRSILNRGFSKDNGGMSERPKARIGKISNLVFRGGLLLIMISLIYYFGNNWYLKYKSQSYYEDAAKISARLSNNDIENRLEDGYDEMLSLFEKSIEYNKSNFFAIKHLLLSIDLEHEHELALNLIQGVDWNAIDLSIRDTILYKLGDLYSEKAFVEGKESSYRDTAIIYYEEALKLTKGNKSKTNLRLTLMESLIRSYVNQSDYKTAITKSNEAIKQFPDSLIFYFFRGIAKLYLGDYIGALLDSEKCIKSDSSFSLGYHLRGYVVSEKIIRMEGNGFKVKLFEEYEIPIYSYGYRIDTKTSNKYMYLNHKSDLIRAKSDIMKAITLHDPYTSLLRIELAKIHFALLEKDAGCLMLSEALEMGDRNAEKYIEVNCN